MLLRLWNESLEASENPFMSLLPKFLSAFLFSINTPSSSATKPSKYSTSKENSSRHFSLSMPLANSEANWAGSGLVPFLETEKLNTSNFWKGNEANPVEMASRDKYWGGVPSKNSESGSTQFNSFFSFLDLLVFLKHSDSRILMLSFVLDREF